VPINSARTDPVISRAAEIWGGFPGIELEDTNKTLPEDIKKYILAKTAT
jgi:muramidase (phage lysozyme)